MAGMVTLDSVLRDTVLRLALQINLQMKPQIFIKKSFNEYVKIMNTIFAMVPVSLSFNHVMSRRKPYHYRHQKVTS